MSLLTERLLQVAALVALLWFGYGLVERSVVAIIIATNRAAQAEQRLQACEQQMRGK